MLSRFGSWYLTDGFQIVLNTIFQAQEVRCEIEMQIAKWLGMSKMGMGWSIDFSRHLRNFQIAIKQ
jgi:hypothetical protein